jgi:flagellar motor protein MotB
MKYTLAIVMLLAVTATSVEAKPVAKHAAKVHAAKTKEAEVSDDNSDDADADDEDEEAPEEAPAKVHKKSGSKKEKSLLELEDDQDEDDVDEEDEDEDDEDEDEESEDDEAEPEAPAKAKGSLVQIGDDEVDHSGEIFKSGQSDMLGDGGYKRVTTPRFASDSDDIFMRSMIENYANEGKNKDGSPNGQFWMSEALTRSAATEVLGTHRGLKGAELTSYLTTYFPRSWAHFDVNRTGQVEVSKMPQFMRFIASDQQMYLW